MDSKRYLPNYTTVNEVEFKSYTSTSSYWTAPINCLASFMPSSGGGTGDSLWTFYVKDVSGSSWNIAAQGADGTYGFFQGCRLLLKKGDNIYFTCNQGNITNKMILKYYPISLV